MMKRSLLAGATAALALAIPGAAAAQSGYGYAPKNAVCARQSSDDKLADNDNSGQVVVGALLGALVGGIAGSEMASSSSANCGSAGPTPYQPSNSYQGGSYQSGFIPRTTDGLYGGPGVMEQSGYPYSQPPARAYPASSYPDAGYSDQGYDDQGYYGEQSYSQEECRMIYLRGEHVMACRNSPTETWRPVNDGAQSQELYGY